MRVLVRLALALVLVLPSAVHAQDPVLQGPPAPQSKPEAVTPPTVVAIHVEGNRRYTAQQYSDALGQKIGTPLDSELIDRTLNTFWQVFKAIGHVQQRLVPGGIELRLTVEEMNADLEPRFIGNSNI